MRTIVIGDIHGCYNELKELIETLENEGKYTKGVDKLVFLGDYIDRGKDSKLVVKFVRDLQKNYDNVVALMGNHEDMLIKYSKGIDNTWTWNGSSATLKSYHGFSNQLKKDIQWMKNLPLYHEDKHFVYVHAGIDPYKATMREQSDYTLLWVREPFIFNSKKYHKKVIFGHTPTANLTQEWKPVQTYADNVGIDTGCVFGGALTALIIDDDKVGGFYQVTKEENNSTVNA